VGNAVTQLACDVSGEACGLVKEKGNADVGKKNIEFGS